MADRQFDTWVSDWVEIDDIIYSSTKQLKTLKARKQELENQIVQHGHTTGITEILIPGGKLKLTVSRRKKTSINRDTIRDNLINSNALKDPRLAERVVEFVYKNNTSFVETTKLKRMGGHTSVGTSVTRT